MLPTPVEHLPPGYPQSSGHPKFSPVWLRAFQIHARDCRNPQSHKFSINPTNESPEYCDCYERAWMFVHANTAYGIRIVRVPDA
jgi:hypothetical protein